MTFIPRTIGSPACDGINAAIPTFDFRFPIYPWTGDFNYLGPCPLRRHDFIQCTDLKWAGGILSARAAVWDAKKSFDISHPSKDGYRLRYICLEGPDAEVYFRGKLKGESFIELPDYWKDLVDMETVGVTLTPIGHWQELFVEKIEWGSKIIIKNNSATSINCDFVVFGLRKDVTKNIPEYPGLTPADYPGDNREYNINGK